MTCNNSHSLIYYITIETDRFHNTCVASCKMHLPASLMHEAMKAQATTKTALPDAKQEDGKTKID